MEDLPRITSRWRELRRITTDTLHAEPLSWTARVCLWVVLALYVAIELIAAVTGSVPPTSGAQDFRVSQTVIVAMLLAVVSLQVPIGTMLFFATAFSTLTAWDQVLFTVGMLFVAAAVTYAATGRFQLITGFIYLSWLLTVALSPGGNEIGIVASSLFLTFLGVLLGVVARHQSGKLQRIEERLRTQQQLREEAVTEERRRIAAEMHDVVAHGLTIVAMQISVLETVDDEAERRTVQRNIREASRQSLTDLRRMLEALRGTGQVPGTEQHEVTSVLASSVEEYAQRLRAADYTVVTQVELASSLSRSLELTLIRLAQECTTNVLKHGAGSGEVQLRVVEAEGALNLTVDSPISAQHATADLPISEFGLLGMRERADLFNGVLEYGPQGARWVTRARLPMD